MDIRQRRPERGASQPFDQRFLTFLLASMAVLLVYQSFFAPPPVAPAPPADAVADKVDDDAAAKPNGADAVVDADATQTVADESDTGDSDAADEIAAQPAVPAQRVALGSVDPDGAYRMLVTIDNVGAAVERVELASNDYRDLEDRTGYLGQLALADASGGGAVVNVVGAGTPAETADVRVGDVLTSLTVDGEATSLDTAEDVRKALRRVKPGDSIELGIVRDGQEQTVSATLRRQPLDLLRPEAENVRLHSPKLAGEYRSAGSFLVRLTRVGRVRSDDAELIAANAELAQSPWTVSDESGNAATLSYRLPKLGVEVVKRFSLVETPAESRDDPTHPSYHFGLAVELRNLTGEPLDAAYELTGPNGLPIEGYWYANKIGRGDGSFFGDWGSFGLRDVVVRYAGNRLLQFASAEVADGDVDPMGQGSPLAFAGVDSQYFASIVLPEKESLDDVRFAELRAGLATPALDEPKAIRWQNASFVLERQTVQLGAAGADDAVVSDAFRVFAGPKLPALLDSYAACDAPDHTLDGVLYYGWFGWAARPMLGLLHFFNGLVGNYGIAIILLTVCVRGAMFPISRQQALNMVKMQQLKPEMDRIAERYKDDMQKRSQAQQELFRKNNYNPAAGCLPLFLQLPIFMGLYRALAVDVELRQAPLFSETIRFCSNLAAPDMFYDWSWLVPRWVELGQGIFALGPYFNILPLATVGLFLLQQRMFMPEPTNEQARLQQKLMQYMMLFMGLLFFKVPSGLCLYFIASSVWGIAERKLLPKPDPKKDDGLPHTPTANVPPKRSKPKSGGGSSNGSSNGSSKKAKRKRSGGKKRK